MGVIGSPSIIASDILVPIRHHIEALAAEKAHAEAVGVAMIEMRGKNTRWPSYNRQRSVYGC